MAVSVQVRTRPIEVRQKSVEDLEVKVILSISRSYIRCTYDVHLVTFIINRCQSVCGPSRSYIPESRVQSLSVTLPSL